MQCELLSKPPLESVLDIVNKTKILLDGLRFAIVHQDNLTKDSFDTTASDLSKTVESIKKTYTNLETEYQALNEDIKAGELRLTNIEEEYKKFLEENETLKLTENGILAEVNELEEHEKTAQELKEKLRVYKSITGVRFDFNISEDILSGYIGISGKKPSTSTLIPFEIDKNNCCKELLWEKLNEACSEITQY